jgi:hypothetical protein
MNNFAVDSIKIACFMNICYVIVVIVGVFVIVIAFLISVAIHIIVTSFVILTQDS